MKKNIASLLILSLSFLTASCGGGGGGGSDFVGAATVNISASPTRIDTADRTEITVNISEINENGIALKIRSPEGLQYVPDSAILIEQGSSIDVSPTVNTSANGKRYLVFYITRDILGKDAQGTLSLFLVGRTETESGKVEVDADVDDPLIGNDVEFDVNSPAFAAADEVSVEVQG